MDMKTLFWILGILTGAAWGAINFILIINILKISVLKKDKAKIALLLLIKFPVLYLVGFLLLISGIFPVMSLLIGVGVILLIIGLRLCLKRT